MNENYGWGLHPGQSDTADTPFLKKNCIESGGFAT
jgi:hypothetical protein